MKKWSVYPWMPCKGKRPRLTYETCIVVAATRKEAKEKYLQLHPQHAGRFISVSRV